MVDYDNLPSDRFSEAQRLFGIPDWFGDFTIKEDWINFEDTTAIDNTPPFTQQVRIIVRYAHEGGKCYRIREFCVQEWKVTTRRGTLVLRLCVDVGKVLIAIRNAKLLLMRQTANALGDYADPSMQTAGGLIDLGIAFKGLPLPQIFGGLGQAISLGQLFDNISEIVDRLEPILRELQRLVDADGSIIARYENVVWRRKWELVKTASLIEDIVEVECADWILAVPEGQTIRVPEHDEDFVAPPPLDEDLERELREIRELDKTVELRGTARSIVRNIADRYHAPQPDEPRPPEPCDDRPRGK